MSAFQLFLDLICAKAPQFSGVMKGGFTVDPGNKLRNRGHSRDDNPVIPGSPHIVRKEPPRVGFIDRSRLGRFADHGMPAATRNTGTLEGTGRKNEDILR